MKGDDDLRLAFVGMHPTRRRTLIDRYGSSKAVLDRIKRRAEDVPDHARLAAAVPAAERRHQLSSQGIQVLLKESFPGQLAELPDSPDVLFARGELPSQPGVAVVGSRKASAYGLRLAEQFGAAIAVAGWPVVSGLAKGIDGAAHRGAVESGGVTIAVLGNGIDRWYPAAHRSLGNSILNGGGAVVSEYPPGTPPSGWRFPPRNRIISGLSAVTVVVEAASRGGALITARAAIDHGREVLAVPGDVDRTTSEGCNLLIRDGAIPVLGPDDLVEAASLILGPPAKSAGAGGGEMERVIGPLGRSVDWIVEQTDRSASDILAELARLEAEGRVAWKGGLVVAC